MAHAQKPDFVFRRNGGVHLNRRGRQFSRLLAGELCTSDCRVCTVRASLCSAIMWPLLVTHSIFLFSLHFSSRASSCAITFQLDSTTDVISQLDGDFAQHIGPTESTTCHCKHIGVMLFDLMASSLESLEQRSANHES
jgi:hypothetical protein